MDRQGSITYSDLQPLAKRNKKEKKEASMNSMILGVNEDLAINETHLEKLEMKH